MSEMSTGRQFRGESPMADADCCVLTQLADIVEESLTLRLLGEETSSKPELLL